jgi:hypothetical protein
MGSPARQPRRQAKETLKPSALIVDGVKLFDGTPSKRVDPSP